MGADGWIAEESRMAAVTVRALTRAAHRPWTVLAIALLATGAFVAYLEIRPPRYEAALYFRMTEGELGDPSSPGPPRAIRQYITNVALSREQAEQVMKRYHRSGRNRERDRVAAIDDFREAIKVSVSRNYFIYDRRPSDPPRSAEVSISLSGSDPDETRDALHAIGDAIQRDQATQRSARFSQAGEFLGAQLATARAHMAAVRASVDEATLAAGDGSGPAAIAARAQLAALEVQEKSAQDRVLALERRAADVAFTAAAEGRQLGLKFELFDETFEATAAPITPGRLARRAIVMFLAALILSFPLVGAFDDRIYTPADATLRGMRLFGALPRFPGDARGSLRERSARRSR
jgi:hypothetical protein